MCCSPRPTFNSRAPTVNAEISSTRWTFLAATAVTTGVWILWSVPAVSFSDMTGEQLATVFAYSLLALIAGLGSGGMGFLLMRALLLRNAFADGVIRALAGTVAGASLYFLVLSAGFPETTPLWTLAAIPAVMAPWIVDRIHRIAYARNEVIRGREVLIADAVDLAATSISQNALLDEVRGTVMLAVDSELAPARSEVARQLRALDEPNLESMSGSTLLRDATHDSVRPLIQLLTSPGIGRADPIGVWGTIRAIIQTQPFHPFVLAIIYALSNAASFWVLRGSLRAALDIALGILLIAVILNSGNYLMRRIPTHHGTIFIATFVVLQVPTVLFLFKVSNSLMGAIFDSFAAVLVSFTLVLLTSSFGSWRQRQEAAQQMFRDLLSEERLLALTRTQLASEVARDVAQKLHGPVQARLAACAVAMEEAARSHDTALYRESLERAHRILNSSLFVETDRNPHTLEEAIEWATEPWRGLVGITWTIEPGCGSSLDADELVESVVEEAISNAVRHGRATQIHLEITSTYDGLTLQVDDNGSGPTTDSPGLGSRLFERASGGLWSLDVSSDAPGACLRIHLPVASHN